MIDFRYLSHFATACEHENLGSAAKAIGISASTLSANLKSLESSFGVSLFRRHENGLSPRPVAHALYRSAVSVLLLEHFAQRRVRAADEPARLLTIDIHLRFAFGKLRRALANTVFDTADHDPLLMIDPQWPLEGERPKATSSLEGLDFAEHHRMTIEAITRAPNPGEVVLRHDPWMLVERLVRGAGVITSPSDSGHNWVVPALPPGLINQISRHAADQGRVLQVLDVQLDDWPQMLEDNPGAVFPLPSSAIGTRLGVTRIAATPLDPPLSATLVARPDRSPEARSFVSRLQAALGNDVPSRAFDPVLTERRARYFNLAFETRRLSAAAKIAGVAQPAMSQQLQKLEASLGVTLFDRTTFGLVRTKAGEQLARTTALLDTRLRDLEIRGAAAALEQGTRLSLGILPAIDHAGAMVACISEAVADVRRKHPSLTLQIAEQSASHLHKRISQGQLGIAIVDEAPPQMPRLALDWSEPLVVVSGAGRKSYLSEAPRLAELVSLPLALPGPGFGIRQLLDAEARRAGVRLHITHEVEALDILADLLSREPVVAILPQSVAASGRIPPGLSIHVIADQLLSRRLIAIHSGQRTLVAAERDFVRALKTALGAWGRVGAALRVVP